jgi:hypothetical protein
MAERINEPTKAVTMYRNSTKRSQIVEEIPGLSKNAAVEIAETNPLPEVVERIARTEQPDAVNRESAKTNPLVERRV